MEDTVQSTNIMFKQNQKNGFIDDKKVVKLSRFKKNLTLKPENKSY